MIYRRDIDNAISECEVEPLTAAKLEKLAHLYIVREYLFEGYERNESKAGTAKVVEAVVNIGDGSVFSQAVDGKHASDVWKIMAEFVDTLEILHPRLHSSLLKKLREIQ